MCSFIFGCFGRSFRSGCLGRGLNEEEELVLFRKYLLTEDMFLVLVVLYCLFSLGLILCEFLF